MTVMQRMDPDRTLQPSEARASRAVGSIFFTLFGALWLALWSRQAFDDAFTILIAIGVVTVALLVVSSRQFRLNREAYRIGRNTPRGRSRSRIFNLINAGQWVVIIAGATILSHTDRSAWILPMVIFTIGLHFIPLGFVLQSKARYVMGGALMLVAVLYPHAAQSGAANPLGALLTGLILWIGAVASLFTSKNNITHQE